jgi:hypothetical protein
MYGDFVSAFYLVRARTLLTSLARYLPKVPTLPEPYGIRTLRINQ